MTEIPQAVSVKRGASSAKFLTPNKFTLGRAQSLFTKEPITIQWIDGMTPGEVLFDVGANVGMYTVWAARRGVKVYAFEPEAGNYDLLCRNIDLNKLDADAYCLAITDKPSVSRLHLSERTVGRSCHSFGASVGPTLKPRQSVPQGCVGLSIDKLVAMGMPVPNHVKIDVDGFEHLVVKGAEKTLARAEVKTVLIELNPAMEQHRGVIEYFAAKGWYLDPLQVARASRPSGEWKGYAEHVFHKFSSIARYTLDRIEAAEVVQSPFRYIYVTDVFDPRIYGAILDNLPSATAYKELEAARGTRGYPERFVSVPKGAFWNDFNRFILSGALREAFCRKFDVTGEHEEAFLVRDLPGYKLGPHSDSQKKIVSALFYLAADDAAQDHGTRIYEPKERGFTCDGSRHHAFSEFNLVNTMPYVPNALFAFPKSGNSFHGVETTTHVRDIMIYDIRRD